MTDAERFWSKVDRSGGDNACWLWRGTKDWDGYGMLSIGGKSTRAHRYALALADREVPPELQACHHCDNPSCVNPAHLFIGTCKDNFDDMYRKGRGPTGDRNGSRRHPEKRRRGARHPRAKLNDDLVRKMREMHSHGMTIRAVARALDLNESHARQVIRMRTWRHVDG